MKPVEALNHLLVLALEYCAIADHWENGPAATGRLEDSARHQAFTATEFELRRFGRRLMAHHGPGRAKLLEASMARGRNFNPDAEENE